MTGEMFSSDVTPEAYPLHFAIAEALGGTVQPFDQYQGPYVLIGEDIRAGDEPYAVAVQGLGVVRLWLIDESASLNPSIYNEASGRSTPFLYNNTNSAIEAAQSVL
ncbi:hypothetical protein LCGC14_1918890 [marine sediment metagenome]|uniref:Uncharacterized protein n=1 Tax=marine sediment metagenome TaxID=412755 RepID=A0A0F9I5C9_9ZZZZ